MWLINWLKSYGVRQGIKEMDSLEPLFAAKIREAQKKFGEISPEEFSKIIVDDVQLKLCVHFGVDPKTVGL